MTLIVKLIAHEGSIIVFSLVVFINSKMGPKRNKVVDENVFTASSGGNCDITNETIANLQVEKTDASLKYCYLNFTREHFIETIKGENKVSFNLKQSFDLALFIKADQLSDANKFVLTNFRTWIRDETPKVLDRLKMLTLSNEDDKYVPARPASTGKSALPARGPTFAHMMSNHFTQPIRAEILRKLQQRRTSEFKSDRILTPLTRKEENLMIYAISCNSNRDITLFNFEHNSTTPTVLNFNTIFDPVIPNRVIMERHWGADDIPSYRVIQALKENDDREQGWELTAKPRKGLESAVYDIEFFSDGPDARRKEGYKFFGSKPDPEQVRKLPRFQRL